MFIFLTSRLSAAVMGVPAHDARDWAFAKLHNLPIKFVAEPKAAKDKDKDKAYQTAEGTLVDSGFLTGLSVADAKAKVLDCLSSENAGSAHAHYKLNDWLVSRQRYWGAPIPIIHCAKCGAQPVPDAELPVQLPVNVAFTGRGGSPLCSDETKAWRECKCPKCQGSATRDTDTLDTFVDSSWYWMRYLSPQRADVIFDVQEAQKWLPVNVYVGGIEHAILHLLYSRFITRFLHKQGLVPDPEPFQRLLTQGMVHGETFKHPVTKLFVPKSQVREAKSDKGERKVFTLEKGADGKEHKVWLEIAWEKMSKSKLNGTDPSESVDKFGADVTRLFILFKAPPDKVLDWNDREIVGQQNFLERVWQLALAHIAASGKQKHPLNTVQQLSKQQLAALSKSERTVYELTNKIIQQYTTQLLERSFNVAVSQLHVLSRELATVSHSDSAIHSSPVYQHALRTLITLLAPLAPHISAELWEQLVLDAVAKPSPQQLDVHLQPWPIVDSAALARSVVTVNVQLQNKFLFSCEIDADALKDQAKVQQLVEQSQLGKQHLGDRKFSRVFFARNRNGAMLNFMP